MTEKPETCPTCKRYTIMGQQQLAVHFRSRPVYGTDMSRPLSELIANIRSQIVQARGQLNDISMGFTGWRERLQDVEGLLTCGLIALHHTREEMLKHEKEFGSTRPFTTSVPSDQWGTDRG